MSIAYHKEIFSDNRIAVCINFCGIQDDVANSSDLKMSIFAYNKTNNTALWDFKLDIIQIRLLYNHLNGISIIKDQSKNVSGKFIELTGNIKDIADQLKTLDIDLLKLFLEKSSENGTIKSSLKYILTQDISNDFWDVISEKNPSLADQLAEGHRQLRRKKNIEELKARLQNTFPETIGDDSWQKWIYKHNWLFGVNYQKPIEKQKISLNGIMPDYLFPTADGFVDILEIKLPSVEVIQKDNSHRGSWIWSKETNSAIGQVVNYLNEIDRLRLEIERNIGAHHHGISVLKPRAYILIGQSDDWDQDQKEGLRKLNHSLHGIEIITYSDLTKRGESFINPINDQEENVQELN